MCLHLPFTGLSQKTPYLHNDLILGSVHKIHVRHSCRRWRTRSKQPLHLR